MQVMKLKKGLDSTSTKIGSSPKDIQDQFGSFLDSAMTESQNLEQGIKDIRDLTVRFAEYFCEDPKKFVLEDCLKV